MNGKYYLFDSVGKFLAEIRHVYFTPTGSWGGRGSFQILVSWRILTFRFESKTRMHSSRMRTGRSLTVS